MTGKIQLNPSSGGGSFSLQAPSSSSNDRVLTLPDAADGIVAQTDSSGNFSVSGTTTCSGTLKAGTITDTSGSNSSTTEQIFQGRARVWWNYNQDGGPTIRDSYRVSSITDNASGKYTVNFQDTLTDPCGAVSASYNANAFDTNYSDVATPYISNTACQVITPNMEGVPYGGLHDCDYGYGVIFSDD